jgi:hypothetical protein
VYLFCGHPRRRFHLWVGPGLGGHLVVCVPFIRFVSGQCSRSMLAALDLRGSMRVLIGIRTKCRSAGRTADVVFVVVAKSREVAGHLVERASRDGGSCTVPVGSIVRVLRLRLHCFCAERLYVRSFTGYEDMLSYGCLLCGNYGRSYSQIQINSS